MNVWSASIDLFAPLITTVIQQTFTKLPNCCKQTATEFYENPTDGSFADTSPAAAVGQWRVTLAVAGCVCSGRSGPAWPCESLLLTHHDCARLSSASRRQDLLQQLTVGYLQYWNGEKEDRNKSWHRRTVMIEFGGRSGSRDRSQLKQ
jgi:hypothetical protein